MKKKLLSLFIAIVMMFAAIPFAFAATGSGDIDGDGHVTPSDARLALRYSVKLENFTAYQIAAADVDMDGKVTPSDARFILRAAVGLPFDGVDVADPSGDGPKSERHKLFETKLYEVAHPLVGTYKPVFAIFKLLQKWCCYYTIHDVFRPTLEQCGYSAAEIDLLAPDKFDKATLVKAVRNGLGMSSYPESMIPANMNYYVPSLLMNHYYNHPEVCKVYNLFDYYDDVVECRMYYRDELDVNRYEPKIGDVLFMSNKTRTWEYGYPTIDHTAQIMEVYEDGTFLCTEGSIIESAENDGIAKVRERTYHFDNSIGTYVFDYNETIIVLTAVRPDLE